MITQLLLDKLNALFETKHDLPDYEGLPVSFRKNKPASAEEIASLLTETGLKLPTDYLEFLQSTNGCILFQYEDLGGFELLGTDKLRNENHLQRNTYEEVWDNRLTVFCRILGDGDFLSFRMAADNS